MCCSKGQGCCGMLANVAAFLGGWGREGPGGDQRYNYALLQNDGATATPKGPDPAGGTPKESWRKETFGVEGRNGKIN